MYLAVQLESRLIYCLNKACLTASASVISDRTSHNWVKTAGVGVERRVGWRRGRRRRRRGGGSVQPLSLSFSLCLWSSGGGREAQLGPCYRSHLMERGLGNSEYQDRYIWTVYPFEMHTCGRVKDTWCIPDVPESIASI